MSVYASQRGESGVEYVDLAWKIFDHSMACCTRLPKRWDRYILQYIMAASEALQAYCVAANSTYPTNQHEAQLRRDYLIRANAELQRLDVLVGHLARKIDKVRDLKTKEMAEKLTVQKTEAMLQTWGELIAKEAKKIAAVKKSNAEQFKKLPPGPAGMPAPSGKM